MDISTDAVMAKSMERAKNEEMEIAKANRTSEKKVNPIALLRNVQESETKNEQKKPGKERERERRRMAVNSL